ncbi:60S ribosomal protein L33-A [Fulvia fulva]|uniref:60S ribosomal protein L33-A n=1 Tax=Passalora fulva TaxID=5499 RepID=A0A9Q8LJD3_PASFU|nr:60S ribosomal protein L33-A [Fulvia fulva]KAK4621401.1 60S ribosomal protein L33-A [Fulvia fulva]KAK4622405.1 60S ribosomal protein L33-A [Fulvia fulva]UJO18483.1 60S ribosomal protein L33-A [Fulvia fulva]WPV15705.1 60S ribosomal protein L33-A [Fulvia fulva]WPV31338.1 60S ribosomal protein L33-A [Fulvia fulva]
MSSADAKGHRLYVKGKHLSYQRGKRNTNPNTSLIKIEGVDEPKGASFYLGKRIAYVYRGKKEIRGTKIRVIWGKVTRTHGNSGLVRAQFRNNLPAKSFGAMVRIMLYPSAI